MTYQAKHPAAFINVIADEGDKAEALEWLQRTWDELQDLRKDMDKALANHSADLSAPCCDGPAKLGPGWHSPHCKHAAFHTSTLETRVCCGDGCDWTGPESECVHPKHSPSDRLCHECHETTERQV